MKSLSPLLIAIFLLFGIMLSACNLGTNASEATAMPATPTSNSNGNSTAASASPTTTSGGTASVSTESPATGAANSQATAPTNSNATASSGGSDTTQTCKPGDGQVVTTSSELKYEDLSICDGVEAKTGMTVAVHYVGTLKDGGAQFDSSYDRGKPFVFQLGVAQVIKGWDEGVTGMKVGSKRRLTIPPSLAYGNRTLPGIPPGSTLVFEITLVSAK